MAPPAPIAAGQPIYAAFRAKSVTNLALRAVLQRYGGTISPLFAANAFQPARAGGVGPGAAPPGAPGFVPHAHAGYHRIVADDAALESVVADLRGIPDVTAA